MRTHRCRDYAEVMADVRVLPVEARGSRRAEQRGGLLRKFAPLRSYAAYLPPRRSTSPRLWGR